jgi:hypothetical protein
MAIVSVAAPREMDTAPPATSTSFVVAEEACPVPEFSEIEPNAPPEETGPYGAALCCCSDPRQP